MNNSLKIYINYYDILSKIFFLGLVFFAILFYILNTSQIFAEEETDTTIFIAYDTDNLNDNEDYQIVWTNEVNGNDLTYYANQTTLFAVNGTYSVTVTDSNDDSTDLPFLGSMI